VYCADFRQWRVSTESESFSSRVLEALCCSEKLEMVMQVDRKQDHWQYERDGILQMFERSLSLVRVASWTPGAYEFLL